MTPEQFVAAINAAQTYDEARAIVLQFQPVFAKLSNTEKVKWRNAWKARKAELQAQ
jgi:hypothetical protein